MHKQTLSSITTLNFPIPNALTVSVSEFSSNIFVSRTDGYLAMFHRRMTDIGPGRLPKLGVQHVMPDRKLDRESFDLWGNAPLSCSSSMPKAYTNIGNNKLYVVNTDTGETLKILDYSNHAAFHQPLFSPDGTKVYVPCTKKMRIFSGATDEILKEIDLNHTFLFLMFSADGKKLYGFGNGVIAAMDPVTCRVINEVSHDEADPRACLSNDGKKIYFPQNFYISVLDSTTLKEISTIGGGWLYGGIANDPGHPYIAACNDNFLEIIDSRIDKIVDRVHLLGKTPTDVAFDKYQVAYLTCSDSLNGSGSLVVARYFA